MSQDLLNRFWEIEQSRRYRDLLPLLHPDIDFYEPVLGQAHGRAEMEPMLARIESILSTVPTRLELHEVVADDVCGWARWTMLVNGTVPVRGQSIYRFEDGLVRFNADMLDTRAYEKATGREGRTDVRSSSGAAVGIGAPNGPAEALVRRFWSTQDNRTYEPLAELFTDDAVFEDMLLGRFEGIEKVRGFLRRMDEEMPAGGITFSLVDVAAGTTCAWTQWLCRLPGGELAGWTLHRVRGDRFTLDFDSYDTATQRRIGLAGAA